MVIATSDDTDQYVIQLRRIRVVALSCSRNIQRRVWSDYTDTSAGLDLRWLHDTKLHYPLRHLLSHAAIVTLARCDNCIVKLNINEVGLSIWNIKILKQMEIIVRGVIKKFIDWCCFLLLICDTNRKKIVSRTDKKSGRSKQDYAEMYLTHQDSFIPSIRRQYSICVCLWIAANKHNLFFKFLVLWNMLSLN